jgi:hypothetical protein
VRSWLFVFSVLAVACTSETWLRVETPHFILRTDLPSNAAKRAGAALEATRDALVSAAWPDVSFKKEPSEVYLLANGLDFERYFGRRTAGLFRAGTPPRFFLYGSADRWELRRTARRPTPSVLRHEMAHQLAAQVWPRQPLWFSEGLANFLEPIFYSDDQRHVVVGAINPWALRSYREVRTIRLRDALAWRAGIANMPEREAAGLYGISWLFVFWLHHRHPAELQRFLAELERGTAADRALQIALPDFDADDVDRELYQFQKRPPSQGVLRPLVETPLLQSSLETRLLNPSELQEVEVVLAETSRLHSGRSRDAKGNWSTATPSDATRARGADQPPCAVLER